MKVYFAGSIRGGREDVDLYMQIITHLRKYGTVLTEHVGDKSLEDKGEKGLSDKQIHDRDMEWLLSANLMVAEVTRPSLGVGYEIGRALEHKKRILCLYRPSVTPRLSAMIAGAPNITVKPYETIDDAVKIIDEYLK
jgi:2'-deoxynucleoside 5'-phosphate N-hydrolase